MSDATGINLMFSSADHPINHKLNKSVLRNDSTNMLEFKTLPLIARAMCYSQLKEFLCQGELRILLLEQFLLLLSA